MAKDFDFKKDGKKQKAFRTPMLNAKVSPGQARLAGKQKQELAKNPNGNSYGFDVGALSFALPLTKVAKAANALKAAGRIEEATALSARLGAKTAGKFFGASERGIATDRAIDVGGRARMASERVFKRLPNNSIPGSTRTFDTYADPLLEGAERFKGKVSLDTLIQGSKSRSGMNRVKVASEVAKGLSKYRKPKGR